MLYIAVLGLTTLFMPSCMDGDWDEPDMTNPPYGNNSLVESTIVTIGELRNRYKTEISNGAHKEITEDVQLKVVVTGNDIGGNLYKQISVQDETGALIIGINANSLYPYLPVGQEILVNLKGLHIGSYGQQAQIGTEYNGGIGRIDPNEWQEHVRLLGHDLSKVDTLDFDGNLDINIHSGYIVKLSNVTINGADGKAVLAPEEGIGADGFNSNCANRNIKGTVAKNIVVRTSTYSDFANRIVPEGPVDLYGVATRYRNTWQILMRSESDLVEKQTAE